MRAPTRTPEQTPGSGPTRYTTSKDATSAVDSLIQKDHRIAAIKRLRDAFPVDYRPGLHEALAVVAERYRELGQRFERYPTPPLNFLTLKEEVDALPGRTVAIEALWDGDSDGWYVDLTALTDDPAAEHRLALIRHGSDMRVFNGFGSSLARSTGGGDDWSCPGRAPRRAVLLRPSRSTRP